MCFAVFLPWLVIIIPAIRDSCYEWYSPLPRDKNSPTYLWFMTLKFNPVCYFHIFVFGMLLAYLRTFLKNKTGVLSWTWRGGATIGYGTLLVIFLVRDAKPYANILSSRLTILMPLQGLILLGKHFQAEYCENDNLVRVQLVRCCRSILSR